MRALRPRHRHVVVLTGEASGDLLAAAAIRAVRRRASARGIDVSVSGVGGPALQQAGLTSALGNIDDLAVMGFAEVVPRLPALWRHIRRTAAAIDSLQPDCILSVDAKALNWRILSRLRSVNRPPCVQLVAPSIWARQRLESVRTPDLRHLIQHLMLLWPFEQPFWRDATVPTTVVGHPILGDTKRPDQSSIADFRAIHRLPPPLQPAGPHAAGAGPHIPPAVVALMPGSRAAEVSRLLPLMMQAVDVMPRNAVIPIVVTLESLLPLVRSILLAKDPSIRVVASQDDLPRQTAMASCDAALVASGTASLQLGLLGVPHVVVYRAHPLTELLARRLAVVRFASLLNLAVDRPVVPELLFDRAQPQPMAKALQAILTASPRMYAHHLAPSLEALMPDVGPGRKIFDDAVADCIMQYIG